jgi:signal-transduction protein with cAMP-binding, CBS, and nucleotidyltransferase domain
MARTVQPYSGSYLTPSFETASVADVMHPGVMSCPPDAPLLAVAQTMATHHVHSVVVSGVASDPVHGEHLVWRLISDMDLVRAAESGIEGRSAEEIAQTEPVTVNPSISLAAAAQLMTEHGTAHLIVTSAGAPIGIVSSLDVAGALAWGRA